MQQKGQRDDKRNHNHNATRQLPPLHPVGPIEVQVDNPQMACQALSPESGPNNDRDEIYMLFSGSAPNNTLVGGRLPRYAANDSYYEYWAGKVNAHEADWTNHDQAPVGRPILWSGTLGVGQSQEGVEAGHPKAIGDNWPGLSQLG